MLGAFPLTNIVALDHSRPALPVELEPSSTKESHLLKELGAVNTTFGITAAIGANTRTVVAGIKSQPLHAVALTKQ